MTIGELKELTGIKYDESLGTIYGIGYTQGVLDMFDIFKYTLTSVFSEDSPDVTMVDTLTREMALRKCEEFRKEAFGNV